MAITRKSPTSRQQKKKNQIDSQIGKGILNTEDETNNGNESTRKECISTLVQEFNKYYDGFSKARTPKGDIAIEVSKIVETVPIGKD